jgi:hypothetical protein
LLSRVFRGVVKERAMPNEVPDEVKVAKLSIEAARIALDHLFEKMNALPRSEKMIVTEKVQEACARLRAAQEILLQLEAVSLDSTPI